MQNAAGGKDSSPCIPEGEGREGGALICLHFEPHMSFFTFCLGRPAIHHVDEGKNGWGWLNAYDIRFGTKNGRRVVVRGTGYSSLLRVCRLETHAQRERESMHNYGSLWFSFRNPLLFSSSLILATAQKKGISRRFPRRALSCS